MTLVKGALATTAIEGNTLTEDQARGILDGSYKASPSRQYQEQEVRNLLDALQGLQSQIVKGKNTQLTSALICDFNRQILHDTELRPDVIPGVTRTGPVVVGHYRAAPAEDVEYLPDRLVVLAMPMGESVRRDDLEGLTPKIAKLYAAAGPRVLSRDLNRLGSLGLVYRSRRGYRANAEIVQAFLPVMATIEG